jgi:hypothetical protein
MTVVLALIFGFGSGVVAWILASRWVAVWLNQAEDRDPALVGSPTLKRQEVLLCGLVFAACLALALVLSRVFWIQLN